MSGMSDTDSITPAPDTPVTGDSIPEATKGTVIPPENQVGDWLAPAAAALRLGISERTLWRHVNAGRYHKRTVAGRAEIMAPGAREGLPDNSDTVSGIAVRQPPDNSLALALLDDLKVRRQEDADTIVRLASELGAERQARQAAEKALADELARRPWWRFW